MVPGEMTTVPMVTVAVCVGEVPPVPVHVPVIGVVVVRTPVDTDVPEVPVFQLTLFFLIEQDVAPVDVQVTADEPPEVTELGEAERVRVGVVGATVGAFVVPQT